MGETEIDFVLGIDITLEIRIMANQLGTDHILETANDRIYSSDSKRSYSKGRYLNNARKLRYLNKVRCGVFNHNVNYCNNKKKKVRTELRKIRQPTREFNLQIITQIYNSENIEKLN